MTTKLAEHTPGPWEVTNRMPAFECVAIVECSPDHALTIDAVGSRRPTQDEWEANARLIAAAPTLLEALTMLHRIALQTPAMNNPDDWEVIEQAWKAINLAGVGAQEEDFNER